MPRVPIAILLVGTLVPAAHFPVNSFSTNASFPNNGSWYYYAISTRPDGEAAFDFPRSTVKWRYVIESQTARKVVYLGRPQG